MGEGDGDPLHGGLLLKLTSTVWWASFRSTISLCIWQV